MSARDIRCAVIGNPIAHSRSPEIHAAFAREAGIALSYERILATEASFAEVVAKFFSTGGLGLNITLPFKTLAFEMAEVVSNRAASAAAVNTLWQQHGKLQGDNTDGAGLRRDLLQNLKWQVRDTRLLLLGAGGAARGVLGSLLELQPQELLLSNRSLARAERLLQDLPKAQSRQITFLPTEELARTGTFDMIINATSSSLTGSHAAIPTATVGKHTRLYDMAYGSGPTGFQLWGNEAGAAESADGLGMLVEQAAESFFIWHRVRVQTAPVIQSLRRRTGGR